MAKSAEDHVRPPDTDLLRWGSFLGLDELSAYERVEEVLGDAIASGALRLGTRNWRTAAQSLSDSVLLGPAPGAPHRTWLSVVVAERVGTWVDLAGSKQLREKRAAIAEKVSVAPAAPDEKVLEAALRPLVWLLEECRSGVLLTQSGYLPPAVVRAAADLFGWWDPFPGVPGRRPMCTSSACYAKRRPG